MKPEMPKDDVLPDVESGGMIMLRLYIANGTLPSMRAQENLKGAIDGQAPGSFKVEVIDILREPLRALSDGILVTPTLVRLSPLPVVKIVGDLTDRSTVLNALGLTDANTK